MDLFATSKKAHCPLFISLSHSPREGHALASSQAVCVSSDLDIATGVMQDQGGASFSDTHHPEPALVPRPDRTAGCTALADPHQEGFSIPDGRLGVAPEPGVVEPSRVAASGISEELSTLHSRVLDTLQEARVVCFKMGSVCEMMWSGSYRPGYLHRVGCSEFSTVQAGYWISTINTESVYGSCCLVSFPAGRAIVW